MQNSCKACTFHSPVSVKYILELSLKLVQFMNFHWKVQIAIFLLFSTNKGGKLVALFMSMDYVRELQ